MTVVLLPSWHECGTSVGHPRRRSELTAPVAVGYAAARRSVVGLCAHALLHRPLLIRSRQYSVTFGQLRLARTDYRQRIWAHTGTGYTSATPGAVGAQAGGRVVAVA